MQKLFINVFLIIRNYADPLTMLDLLNYYLTLAIS